MEQFIYQFKEKEGADLMTNPGAWTEEIESIGADHFAHLKKGTEEGIVIIAGRDPSGVGPAIVIFEAENEEKAQAFMLSDPFVKEGLFLADLYRFGVALQRS